MNEEMKRCEGEEVMRPARIHLFTFTPLHLFTDRRIL